MREETVQHFREGSCNANVMDTSTNDPPTLIGGKGKGKGKGKGGRGGFGQGQGQGKGKGGGGAGIGRSAFRDVSICMLPVVGTGRKGDGGGGAGAGEGAGAGAGLPPAHIAANMENNLRVAREVGEWLRMSAACIDVKQLEKIRFGSSMCIPRAYMQVVEGVIASHKELILRISEISSQVIDMSAQLHVDPTSFKDATNKTIDIFSEQHRLEDCFVDGTLRHGGVDLRSLMFTENHTFRTVLLDLKDTKPDAWYSRLMYNSTDNTFAVIYATNSDPHWVVFKTGQDGRAVSPHVDRVGSGVYDVTVVSEVGANKANPINENNNNSTLPRSTAARSRMF